MNDSYFVPKVLRASPRPGCSNPVLCLLQILEAFSWAITVAVCPALPWGRDYRVLRVWAMGLLPILRTRGFFLRLWPSGLIAYLGQTLVGRHVNKRAA